MVSDVEVLRAWLGRLEAERGRVLGPACPSSRELAALSSAIAALEAREAPPTEADLELERQYVKHGIIDPPRAQPKVEGAYQRLGDDAFEMVIKHEGRWRCAGRPQEWAETRLAIEARRARASEAALSERVAALTAQNAYLRQTLEDVREWAGPKHVMVFDDGDVAVSDYVQTALDFKGVQIPAAPRPEFKP